MSQGGPSQSSCESRKTPFITKSRIIKYLSLLQYKLMNCDSNDSPEPVINNKNLLVFVYPCVDSNDGPALEPVVEFDVVSKTNVRLSVTEDMDFIKAKTPPDPKVLSDLIITEAVVENITSLDNKMLLAVSVVYSTKSGKSGENLTKLFTNHIKVLQVCGTCTKLVKLGDLIINDSSLCSSYCEPRFTSNRICDKCKEIGHFDVCPVLRFCTKCLSLKQQCIRRVFFIIRKETKKCF